MMGVTMKTNSFLAAVGMMAVALGTVAWAAGEDAAGTKPAATQPSTQSSRVDVTKKDQIEAAVGKDEVVVVGTVEKTRWTASGKTFIVTFKDGPEDFRAVGYGKNREALDAAFGGDIAKALEGKQVEITGKVAKYEGSVENWKGLTQIAINKPEQVKVVGEEKK
jgi:DNA/RNA endonuclease YhcR with UshA esterase domain